MKQNIRKNKTKQSVVWPTTSYFTIKELWALNDTLKQITLRVKLTNAIQEGLIAEIGCVPGSSGRPQKVFTITPVTQTVLNKAESNKINLIDNAKSLVNVISLSAKPIVNNISSPLPKSVV